MANIYVDPDGSNTSPYETWAKASTVAQNALNLATDGDVVIFKNRQDHAITANVLTDQSFTVQNEDGDEDYTKVGFSGWQTNRVFRVDGANIVTIKGVTWAGLTYTGFPNAILTTLATATGGWKLYGVRFSGCDWTGASGGGGICNIQGPATGAVFEMYNCVIEDCDGGTDSKGVGIISDCDTVIDNLTMRNNGDRVGGLFGHLYVEAIEYDATLRVTDSDFTNNWQLNIAEDTGDGGSFYLYCDFAANGGQQLTSVIERCTFQDGGANKGGAFWAGQDTITTVENCLFKDNQAFVHGGGAVGKGANATTSTDAYLTLKGCVFDGNSSGNVGGAVRVDAAKYALIYNCLFVDNTTTTSGDSVYVVDHAASGTVNMTIMKNCVVQGTANDVHLRGDGNDGFDTISDCVIDGGTSEIADTGATVSDITDAAPAIALDYSISHVKGVRWWIGANPVGYGGEPIADWSPSIGAVQSKEVPFHPINL